MGVLDGAGREPPILHLTVKMLYVSWRELSAAPCAPPLWSCPTRSAAFRRARSTRLGRRLSSLPCSCAGTHPRRRWPCSSSCPCLVLRLHELFGLDVEGSRELAYRAPLRLYLVAFGGSGSARHGSGRQAHHRYRQRALQGENPKLVGASVRKVVGAARKKA